MRRFGIAILLGLATLAPLRAEVELFLQDGQVLKGRTVERKEGFYLLELETGAVLPIPVELVAQLGLSGGVAEQDQARRPTSTTTKADEPGEPDATADQDAQDGAPTGLRKARPQTLVGPPGAAHLPQHSQQVAALGKPATFQPGVIDPNWHPRDAFAGRDVTQFNPARWYRPPIDPNWQPQSAYSASDDVTEFNPARWYRAPIDSTWWPTDGFRDRPSWFHPPSDSR